MSRLVSLLAICVLTSAGAALAQSPAGGRLLVTVVDQSGGVIPNATVTVTGVEAATKAAPISSLKTTEKGVATFDRLGLGHYAIVAEFPAFNPNGLKDVTIKAGDNKYLVVLTLQAMQDSVTVTRDRQEVGSSRDVLFGSALTREQIDALSDDPVEMQRQLQLFAGLDATIRVDSFEGQPLPTKAQIKSIHITRDQFAAESHTAGGKFVDIITQPGVGPVRTNLGGNFHNNAMEARNPFAPAKGPARQYEWQAGVGGSLIGDRATFSVAGNQANGYMTPNVYAATPAGGTLAENLNLRRAYNDVGFSGLLDYAVTKDQTIRMGFGGSDTTNDNLGVGNFDKLEKAYSTVDRSYNVRMTEAGPLGRRFFSNTRFSLSSSNTIYHSVSEAIGRSVLDAFNEGGAQQKGGTRAKVFLFASDLDYVRGKNSWRVGIQVDGSRYRSDQVTNYNGTYTFESLAAYQAGTPRSFTQRVGDPTIQYWHAEVGLYIQDDLRLRKNLVLSPGVRFEAQTHLRDYSNIGPRFGATWSPFKSGNTSVRGSWGIFYDWLPAGVYAETVQNDGFHLREINVDSPTYPATPSSATGTFTPVNRYQYGSDMHMWRNMRVAGSINQTLTERTSVSTTISDLRGYNLPVGSDLNAPVAGLRPNSAFANIFATNSTGRAHSASIVTSFTVNLAPLSPASGYAQRFLRWRRSLALSGYYSLAKSENNTDGAFAVPATGNLASEWGPSSGDIRHRLNVSISSKAFRNLYASVAGNWSSAPPITIRTGTDNNGDLIFNDRPAGVGRNSARTVANWGSSASLSYSLAFGRKQTGGGGPQDLALKADGTVKSSASMTTRYRLGLYASIQNLTNHRNLGGFSGVQTSPFFLKPTQALGQRAVYLSAKLNF